MSQASTPTPHFESQLNDSDTILWNIERDPVLRTTIVAIALLDRPPDWERLRARILDASVEVPRLRQRVVAAPFQLGPPRWETVDNFDIDYHLRRVAAAPPGDLGAVLGLAAPIAMAAFDKERPLWEFTLVEGMAGGQAALIEKVHHSFTDGVGGMRLARMFLDEEHAGGSHRHRPSPAVPRRASGPLPAAAEIAATNLRRGASALRTTARTVPRLGVAAIRDPQALAGGALRGARSVVRLLRPAMSPLSPIMRERGMSRRLIAFDVPFADLSAAGHAVDGTVNDAFLAAVAGGLQRYHQAKGAEVAALRVTMPVNLRGADDGAGNNRFSPVRFTLPLGDGDPAARMRALGDLARRWRHEPALPVSDVIAGVLNRLPVVATTALFGSMLKGIDFVATNVPGLSGPAHLAGAEVLRHYAFPPPSGAACGIALLSHGEQACIGVTIDLAAVTDPDLLGQCLRDGFADVLAVAPTRHTRKKVASAART